MILDFFKMHAQGNDYIYFDLMNKHLDLNWPEIALNLSNRNKGIGADGIVLIESSFECNAKMRIFNADGSEAEMCGSALRCVSSYLIRTLQQEEVIIETNSGIKLGKCRDDDFSNIEVFMGYPKFMFNLSKKTMVRKTSGYVISTGNPHFIFFSELLPKQEFYKLGREIELDSLFPDKINVHQVEIINKNRMKMQIWERGSGATLACGTGACAAAFAAIQVYSMNNEIEIELPGGNVQVRYNSETNEVYLGGRTEFVFKGQVNV